MVSMVVDEISSGHSAANCEAEGIVGGFRWIVVGAAEDAVAAEEAWPWYMMTDRRKINCDPPPACKAKKGMHRSNKKMQTK
jgi:hypothetical protein